MMPASNLPQARKPPLNSISILIALIYVHILQRDLLRKASVVISWRPAGSARANSVRKPEAPA